MTRAAFTPAELRAAALTPEQVRERLSGADAKVVAAAIGHDHTAVWRFLTGRTKRPAWELVRALQQYLEARRAAKHRLEPACFHWICLPRGTPGAAIIISMSSVQSAPRSRHSAADLQSVAGP